MRNHFETRYQQDYIAKLSDDGTDCTEIVFFKGEQIHRAEFPTSNLGTASRSGYLLSMVVTVAREHKAATRALSTQPSPTIANTSLTSVERVAVKLGNLPADYSEMDRVSSPAYRKAERAVAKETARRQRY